MAIRRAIQINSISGMCLTKLDVLDGLKELKICTGYQLPDGSVLEVSPMAAEAYDVVTPIYETLPGWSETTFGAKTLDALPQAALDYIKRIEELTGIPIDIISTGPDRNETIIKVHPYSS
ncbi:adenylosuccinate synthetase [Vibrio variabilis]|uniref:Adenylosuccinate synthetase n=1 Tax=Vibrio variabilis TaxID=990271 RepID=A0ABQ0J749_9VIBR|nr:adenylosuccinate synthetase [Vibrio variabilis]